MQDKKLDDPSNQETKEPSLVCMIGDIPNEATAVDNKVRNICLFSPLVSSKREKNILPLFAQIVYFLRDVCLLPSKTKKSKLTEQN